ncbi:group 1 truncated hemoglobin [Agromyces seonyuensis]|uniref:Group 1 truncated hemoglobin n=1 Tax=Agromyces seonyuensis TaxID=2662446 RepID=A0A6I4NWE0_9MICO|nr:group 1 truncated hemoglobin [Agromyces seonyuensis]
MTSLDVHSEPEAQSDYAAVGGGAAVSVVVNRFYELVLADDSLAHHFDGVEMARLKRHQVALVSQVMGGPVAYEGRDLRTAHEGKGITGEQFGAVAGHLIAALAEAGVPAEIIDRTVAAVAATQPDVVEVPSTEA